MIDMKLILALVTYEITADDALQMFISANKAEVPSGGSVTYTCYWQLDDEHG